MRLYITKKKYISKVYNFLTVVLALKNQCCAASHPGLTIRIRIFEKPNIRIQFSDGPYSDLV